jgi:hypothetical protein
MAVQVKTLTINELRRQESTEPIYVLNGTMRNPKDRANIVIMMPLRDGEAQDPIPIFATWVPVCVTDKIEREQVLKSRQFLQALERKIIIAIPEEEALKILDQPGAKEEIERIRVMDINTAVGDAADSLGGDDGMVKVDVPGGDTDEGGISYTVLSYVELMETNSGLEALNSLRNLGDLSLEEYQHVLKTARGLGESHKEVIGHCKLKISELKPQAPVSAGGKAHRVA